MLITWSRSSMNRILGFQGWTGFCALQSNNSRLSVLLLENYGGGGSFLQRAVKILH